LLFEWGLRVNFEEDVGEKLLDDRPHRTTPAVTPGISPTSSSKAPLKPHSKSIPNRDNKINNNKIYNNKPLSDPQLIKKNNELAKLLANWKHSKTTQHGTYVASQTGPEF
jgi:hypothetical protein